MHQVLNTITNQRFNIAACNGAHPSALSSTLVYVNDCGKNELLDFASRGSRRAITGNPFGPLSADFMVSIDSGAIGYSAAQGLFHIDSDGNYFLLSSDHDMNAVISSFYANENFSVAVLATSIHWWANSQARQSTLGGLNLMKVHLKGSQIFFAAETDVGEPLSGTLDLAADRSTTRFNLNTKLKELIPLQR